MLKHFKKLPMELQIVLFFTVAIIVVVIWMTLTNHRTVPESATGVTSVAAVKGADAVEFGGITLARVPIDQPMKVAQVGVSNRDGRGLLAKSGSCTVLPDGLLTELPSAPGLYIYTPMGISESAPGECVLQAVVILPPRSKEVANQA